MDSSSLFIFAIELKMTEYNMQITPMEMADAKQIIYWKYSGEYSIYNLSDSRECRDELLDGTYYAAKDNAGRLIGFLCFGKSAQVSAGRLLGLYEENLLDIGLGVMPELCGKGLGLGLLKCGMAYAEERFHPAGFRLTVAAFNRRAITVYERAGYEKTAFFTNAANGIDFMVMRKSDFTLY